MTHRPSTAAPAGSAPLQPIGRRIQVGVLLAAAIAFAPTATAIAASGAGVPTATAAAAPTAFPTRWRLAGYAVGPRAGNDSDFGSIIMADVIQNPAGGYRMYYTHSTADHSSIRIAESTDGLRWNTLGVVLESDPDPADREFVLGGASVVPLADGRWRMYYRASPRWAQGQPPAYHIRSAISADGIHFEREPGVRIDIAPNDPASPFTLVGHGRVWPAAGGGFQALFSANFSHDHGASDLVWAESANGLSWSGFRTVYPEAHDPGVTRWGNRWVAVARWLDRFNGYATSADGKLWEPCLAPLTFTGRDGRPLPSNAAIADIGIVRGPGGEAFLYTNFGVPSSDIAIFRPVTGHASPSAAAPPNDDGECVSEAEKGPESKRGARAASVPPL